MDDIRRQVITLSANERRFLLRRQADGRAHERETLRVGVFIAALSVTMRVLIALGLKHLHSRRQAQVAASVEGAG